MNALVLGAESSKAAEQPPERQIAVVSLYPGACMVCSVSAEEQEFTAAELIPFFLACLIIPVLYFLR